MAKLLTLLIWCSYVVSISRVLSAAADILITANQSLRDGATIVSAGGNFEMGFFSPINSNNRFFGIWYKNIPVDAVVWVANRDTSLTDSSGALKMTVHGILAIFNRTDHKIWSSNASRPAYDPVAQLMDSGNLVVRNRNESNPEDYLWQSFDYPCHVILPDMKLGRNIITGHDWYLTSWKSSDDPSPGDYTYRFDPNGFPQEFLRSNSVVQFRSGPWNGVSFSGFPLQKPNPVIKYGFVFNKKEMYYSYEILNNTFVSKLALTPNGMIQRFIWANLTRGWNAYGNRDICDTYGLCGAYATCDINNLPVCMCLKGFVPKYPKHWNTADWSGGCVRRTPLSCQNRDGFFKHSGVKVPDTRSSWFNESMNLEECKSLCLKNCSCTAYTNTDIRQGGSGCLLWFGELIDMKEFPETGQDVHIRVAPSELEKTETKARSNVKKRMRITVISSVLITATLLLAIALILYVKKRKKQIRQALLAIPNHLQSYFAGTTRHGPGRNNESPNEDLELPLFDLAVLATATNNFSADNKLGEGGFGPVYKGMLKEGQEVAVKRLSRNSRQGLHEFKNEVKLIVRLQHRNLVKLHGCCIHKEERMLVYEYMPNKSLDYFLFGRSMLLDWPKRFHIISGVARGLLYLHQDSRLRIIHRDLKADNVLLDYELNPKISDFGMARCFGEAENTANTNRVVGTYGYMSPEYASEGRYSVKSDVYSFGVLVLEIVSGKRNRGFCHPGHCHSLLGHAWTLFMEERSLELIDVSVGDSYSIVEVLRSIHVGLLCVQQCPEDRPSMSSVVLMFSGDGALPRPKQPGFFTKRNRLEADTSSSKHEQSSSTNELSITLSGAR
ncbi:G-type lectin S-receptor-like serine/threonine-protein kinase At4g27290 [Malania oleifera]|uniref:G-type lectin S-receptor-like serine/threonine-protein kinase At4g27290 n=1 Tax=Malania oleifera TaxID=397392 RepID=UPI0025AE0D14|nr:G-type lectin S-receptor-like serine/threonine-protein kinase At4g27290 [Malania oleifera]